MTEAITRTPLCATPYCPAPNSPDFHLCPPPCGALSVEHHHVALRGMGGSRKRRDDPRNIIALCPKHHRMVTEHEAGDAVMEMPDGSQIYRMWDLRNETLLKRVLAPPTDAPPEAVPDKALEGAAGELTLPSEFPTFDAWTAHMMKLRQMGFRLKVAEVQWCFAIGDAVNAGEARFGEMASQYIDRDIGLSYWKVATYASVARRVPLSNRLCGAPSVTFEHHHLIAALPPPEQREWLERVQAEGLSTRALKAACGLSETAPSRERRFTLAELRDLLTEFCGLGRRRRGVLARIAWAFLDWLAKER